ncbi:MAG: tetratricopeptide repeat protein [Alphaproteobacteria bacterium]
MDLFSRAQALHQKGQPAEAARLYQEFLAIEPGHFGALNLYAIAATQLGQTEDAERALRRAIEINGTSEVSHYNHGTILRQLGRLDDALASFDRALAINPDSPDSWNNRAVVLKDLERPADALESLARSLALRPNHAETLSNQANTLAALGRPMEAIAAYQRALAIRPDAAVLVSLGNALRGIDRNNEALAAYDRALALVPGHADALQQRYLVLMTVSRHSEAIATAQRALALDPNANYMLGHLIYSMAHLADWGDRAELEPRLHRGLAEKRKVCVPFELSAIDSTPAEQLDAAQRWVMDLFPPHLSAYRHEIPPNRERLRIGYMSGEYRAHATSFLIAELFELHDRQQFEIVGVGTGADDDSATRRRLEAAFDEFADVSALSDGEAARVLNERKIDILVDLNGYSGRARPGILARRPAPIQVNYLAYPGTSGAPYVDYILADRRVIPPAHQPYYSESVVYLPDSYQVNDSRRPIAPVTPSRSQAGLSEGAFVFCCFNSTHKITPATFQTWMEILREVEGSVLWLLEANTVAAANLRSEAARCGVAPDRLVFAPMMALPEHLARHRLADLFLDTLPYNAHTTASDALWAGLPVLTWAGNTFAGRVAGSLLNAIGLADMIAETREDYMSAAIRLARDPDALRNIRERLAANRLTHPLFDTARFARHIESAFLGMWRRYRQGQPPAGFSVESLPIEMA